jgi:hypothetical protein
LERLENRDCLEELGVDGRILKWTFSNRIGRRGFDSPGSEKFHFRAFVKRVLKKLVS